MTNAEDFMVDNTMHTIAGLHIGSSGIILSYIMCNTMNRSLYNVISVKGLPLSLQKKEEKVFMLKQQSTLFPILLFKARKLSIRPVARRMSGQFNVLLEVGILYDIVYEMEEINEDFSKTYLILVIGTNDIANANSPISVWNAKNVIINKRIIGSGNADIDNPLLKINTSKEVCGKIRN
jgi:NAD(P) transhydrogenase